MYGSILYFAFAHHDYLRLRQTLLNHQSTRKEYHGKVHPLREALKKEETGT